MFNFSNMLHCFPLGKIAAIHLKASIAWHTLNETMVGGGEGGWKQTVSSTFGTFWFTAFT